MKILAIHGSPRRGGNSELLLDAFLEGAKGAGALVEKVNLYERKFSPCIECGECDHLGECVLRDDMDTLYQSYLEADLLVVATPIFFYSHTSMVQAFFERFQAFWARKIQARASPSAGEKPQGNSFISWSYQGKKIFEATIRTFKYVIDAGWGTYVGGLFFREIDQKGEILQHPEALKRALTLGKAVVLDPEEVWDLDRSASP